MANIQLSKNLTTLRKSFSYTQLDVSKMLNISRQAYTNYEKNHRSPDIDTLIRISNIYNVSLDTLINSNINTETSEFADPTPAYQQALNIITGDTLYLNEDEVSIIMNYRDLSDNNKKIIKTFFNEQMNPSKS